MAPTKRVQNEDVGDGRTMDNPGIGIYEIYVDKCGCAVYHRYKFEVGPVDAHIIHDMNLNYDPSKNTSATPNQEKYLSLSSTKNQWLHQTQTMESI